MKNCLSQIITITFLAISLLSPVGRAWAGVIFSEIAWMGGSNSSADEWIEIYNDSESDVNLDGYTIVIEAIINETESKKTSIKLSGIIGSKKYYLIERTDDNSVPNITSDLPPAPFGSGLNNSGNNLYLKNAEGQNADSLLFSSGWPAGDNATKQTMQFVGGQWLTAESTPKSAPLDSSTSDQTNNLPVNNPPNNPGASQSTGGSVYVPLKNQSRFIVSIAGDMLAQIPTLVELDHRYDQGIKNNYGIYRVNFGDGNTKDFKPDEKITHTYEYPGYYRITLKFMDSAWSIIPKKQTFINVQIDEPLIYIDTSRAPILIIKNKSSKDIDLGGFTFTDGVKTFSPPEGSIVFANKEVWLAPSVTGFSQNEILGLNLLSKAGQAIALQTNSQPNTLNTKTASTLKPKILSQNKMPAQLLGAIEPTWSLESRDSIQSQSANISEAQPVQNQNKKNLFIWFLFGALILGGSLVFIKLRKIENKEANEFSLLEE